MAFRVNGTNSVITTTGDIGLGTLSPTANISIVANTSNTLIHLSQAGSGLVMNVVNGTAVFGGNLRVTGTLNVTGNVLLTGTGGNTFWHSGNDGAGSGLDADLLDGNNSNFFTNATNMTTGTLPTGRLSGAYTGINSLGTLTDLDVTGNVTIDLNTLYVDTVGNKVGIGKAPNSALDVVGSANISNNITVSVGSEINPSFRFNTHISGFYSAAAGRINYSLNGVDKGSFEDSVGATLHTLRSSNGSITTYLDAYNGTVTPNNSTTYTLISRGRNSANSLIELGQLQVVAGNTMSGRESGQWRFLATATGSQSVELMRLSGSNADVVYSTLTMLDSTRLQLIDGAVTIPSIHFASDIDTGFYRSGTDAIGVTLAGAQAMNIRPQAVEVTGMLNVSSHATISGRMNVSGPIYSGANTVWHSGNLDLGSNTAWHSGNDGVNSGLDADLLDGLQGSVYTGLSQSAFTQANTANTRAYATALKTGDTFSGNVTFNANVSMVVTEDGSFINFLNDGGSYRVAMGGVTVQNTRFSIAHNPSSNNISLGLYNTTSAVNNRVVFELTPSGITSNTRAVHIIGESETGSDHAGLLIKTSSGGVSRDAVRVNRLGRVIIGQQNQINTSANVEVSGNVLTTSLNVTTYGQFGQGIWVGSNTVWHSGNDGSGSGLDADLLDGNSSAFYTNATNITTGTLPSGRLSGNYASITGVGTLDQLVIGSGHYFDPSGPFIRGSLTDLGAGLYGIQNHGQTSIGSRMASIGYYNSVAGFPAYYTIKHRGTKENPIAIEIDDAVGSFRSYANSGSDTVQLVGGIDITSNSEGGATITSSRVPGRMALGVTTNAGDYTEGLVLDNRANVHVPTIFHIGGVRQLGLQSFTVQMRYSTGSVQHRIGRTGDASGVTGLVAKITNATNSYANTPTGTDASTGFNSTGMKISSSAVNRLIFNTADQTEIFQAFQGIATVGIPNAGAGVGTILGTVHPRLISRDVNGTTRYRLEADLYTLNGSDFDIATRLAAGESFALNFLVGLV
jgi:hypothetical protein